MKNNTWVPMVLKDVEAYCHQNELPEFARHVEDLRLRFKQLQRTKKLSDAAKEPVAGPLKLVWSQDELSEDCPEKLLAERN